MPETFFSNCRLSLNHEGDKRREKSGFKYATVISPTKMSCQIVFGSRGAIPAFSLSRLYSNQNLPPHEPFL